jgi:hypothetical protein
MTRAKNLWDGYARNGIMPYKKPFLRSRLYLAKNPVSICRSRHDGETDLLSLARKAKYESAWVFSHDWVKWYNVNVRHVEPEFDGYVAQGHTMFLFDYSDIGNRVTSYHTHNRCFESKLLEQTLSAYPQASNESRIAFAGFNIRLPSREDIGKGVTELEITDPRTDLDIVVVSPYGFTTVAYKSKKPSAEIAKNFENAAISAVNEMLFSGQQKIEENVHQKMFDRINELVPDLTVSFREIIPD